MANINTVPGRYWHRLDEKRIQCDLCPRFCKLHEGQRGLCFVRKMEQGQMTMTSYGRSSGFCVDPVEKKPLNHFYPGSSVLSFGTAGCNLACKFCQNWDISKSRENDRLADQASPEQLASTANQMGCTSIAYTYNDPVIFLEYAVDVAQACHEQGLKNIAVTAGYITELARDEFFSNMDAVNIDLKAFTEKFYKNICGGHLESVLETLIYLKNETTLWFEITNLLIPGENDSEKEIEELTQWIVENLGEDVPVHFTAFHPDWKMLGKPATSPKTVQGAKKIAHKNGVKFVYTGNIHDAEGGSTFCPQCKTLLIERDWYQLGQWHMNKGKCANCGQTIAGVFADKPEHWGRKRVPIKIA